MASVCLALERNEVSADLFLIALLGLILLLESSLPPLHLQWETTSHHPPDKYPLLKPLTNRRATAYLQDGATGQPRISYRFAIATLKGLSWTVHCKLHPKPSQAIKVVTEMQENWLYFCCEKWDCECQGYDHGRLLQQQKCDENTLKNKTVT